jgi:OmcA/MtrC family decaheme c-type cytochrome
MTPEQFAATEFNATITSVTVASPPVVNFKVVDQFGVPIAGLGLATKSATATVPRYQNLAFSMAKWSPTPCATAAEQVGQLHRDDRADHDRAATAQRPSTDSNGTLVDNGNGTYQYTFFRDITQVKAQVDAMTLTGLNVKADLGDLTFDPNAIHRVALQISGNAPGHRHQYAQRGARLPGVPMSKPNNAIFDFIPATGQAVPTTDPGERLIVDKLSCNECHGKLGGIPGTDSEGFHAGSRYDPSSA